MVILFKELSALKTSVATLSSSLQNLPLADQVVTFMPADTGADQQPYITETPELLPQKTDTTKESVPITKKKAAAAR
jgi:hypothetical protein